MLKKTSAVFFFCILSACLFAQSKNIPEALLKFSGIQQRYSLRPLTPFTLAASEKTGVPSSLPGRVDYPAFFCRMELRSVDRFHVWLKFHAGEYDKYMMPNTANR